MNSIPFTIESDNVLDLVDLLPKLPTDLILKSCNKEGLSTDEKELLKKMSKASENANVPILEGISAIGELLAYASDDVSESAVQNIGWLIQSLGKQAAAVDRLKSDVDCIVHENEILKQMVTATIS